LPCAVAIICRFSIGAPPVALPVTLPCAFSDHQLTAPPPAV
jgi:hypothetical protein